MDERYHVEMLTRGLSGRVSARALAAITRANLAQDRPSLLLGHPEYHYDP